MKTRSDARNTTAGLLLAALLGLPFLGACVAHGHPVAVAHHHSHGGAVRVVVAKGHVHSARCGHYRHRGHWYHLRGHVHGPRCGHHLVGGVWVIRR